MRAGNSAADIVNREFSRFATFVRLAACAQAASAQLNRLVRSTTAQGLRVSVGADKFHALHTAFNHVTYSVTAAAANTNHFDLCALVELFNFNHFDAHGALLFLKFLKTLKLKNKFLCCLNQTFHGGGFSPPGSI